MQFSVERDKLLSTLKLIDPVTRNAAPALGVLSAILIEASEKKVVISGTDLEISIRAELAANTKKDGAICVPTRLLLDLTKEFDAESRVTFKVEKGILHLTCNVHESHVRVLSADEFPHIPVLGDNTVQVEAQPFARVLRHVVNYASSEANRPILTGIRVNISDQGMTVAGADGYRLAVDYTGEVAPSIDIVSIIPARAISVLTKAIDDELATIEFDHYSESHRWAFRVGNIEVGMSELQGTYPDYMAIVPQSHALETHCVTNALEQAVRLAVPYAKDAANAVKLTFTHNTIEVGAISQEAGNGITVVNASVNGDGFDASLNYQYLLEALANIETEYVLIRASEKSPLVVLPDDDLHEHLQVIMPMSVGK